MPTRIPYNHVLTSDESFQWWDGEPDRQRYWRHKIASEIGIKAMKEGFDEWFIYDENETLLADGKVAD